MVAMTAYWAVIGGCAVGLISSGCLTPVTNTAQSTPTSSQRITNRQEIEDKIRALRDAVAAAPHDVAVRLSFAIALQDQGQLEAAAEELRRVIRLTPRDALVYNLLGDVYLDQGRKAIQNQGVEAQEKLKAAAGQFDKSVQLTQAPNLRLAALLGLGATYEEVERLYLRQQSPKEAAAAREKARLAFEEALKICPECKKHLAAIAIERAWPRSGLPSVYENLHSFSFEQRIRGLQDEITRIRSQAAKGHKPF